MAERPIHEKLDCRIAVIGLGYVGLPLAVALAAHYPVVGFDVNLERIEQLRRGEDRTGEISKAQLNNKALLLECDTLALGEAEVFIVAVPTPVDAHNKPDLSALEAASALVGKVMRPDAVVVFESTVYPGVTEDVCGKILEKESGLRCGVDFFLGYSPERINPGDREHTVDQIIKVVAGQTPEIAERLKTVYGSINGGNIFIAADIRTAEASKVIENAQRDINIAFINEISVIFDRLGLSTQDVLAAAGTKWNFLNFSPGLVGGHCIGVDPYYLAHVAELAGLDPAIVLAGRRINDGMSKFIAERVHEQCKESSLILVLGITFKENVPDIRNSKVVDLVRHLEGCGHTVEVHDPLADSIETEREYGIKLLDRPLTRYDSVIVAVAHDVFRTIKVGDLLVEGGLVADFKGTWRDRSLSLGYRYWSL
jgi:UDP-N-acetyl-D-galactosamine dehydrogenase